MTFPQWNIPENPTFGLKLNQYRPLKKDKLDGLSFFIYISYYLLKYSPFLSLFLKSSIIINGVLLIITNLAISIKNKITFV